MRGPKLGAAIAATVLAFAAVALSPARAGAELFAGVVPDLASGERPGPAAQHRSIAAESDVRRPTAHAAGLEYGGGPVLHFNRTHLIFWQPSGSGLTFDAGYQSLIERLLTDVAADSRLPTNVYGLSGQYRDAAGPAAYASTYRGAVLDTDPLPANGCSEPPPPPAGTGPGWPFCLTAQQLRDELTHVLDADGLPQSPQDIYFLVTPAGLGSCESQGPAWCALGGDQYSGYCGYHTATFAHVPYAVIPYNALPGHCQSGNPRPNASTADPAISTLSHEHNESVTDPLGNAWRDASGKEEADLCVKHFGVTLGGNGADAWNQVINGHPYYVQQEWSDAAGACQSRANGDLISFSAVRHGQRPGRIWFSARVTRTEGPIQSFDWFFGDRRKAHRRRVLHTFRRAGSYRVVLRATDSWGNWAFYARKISVGP